MKRLPIRSLRARLVQYAASRAHLSKCSFSSSKNYEPFVKRKDEGNMFGAQEANVAGDNAAGDNTAFDNIAGDNAAFDNIAGDNAAFDNASGDVSFDNVDFDDNVATSLTFDISVEEEKWRDQEEMEYQRFMRSVGSMGSLGSESADAHAHSIESAAGGETDLELLKGLLHKGEKNAKSVADAVTLVNKKKNILLNLEERHANSFFNQVGDHVQQIDRHSLIDLIRGLSKLNMKNRIRDLCYEIAKMLKEGEVSKDQQENQLETKLCLHCVTVLNRHSLYFSEFYDYMASKVGHLDIDALVSFAEECYKHSLRTKHYLDKLVPVCVAKIGEFNLDQLKSLFHSFHRFCKEYSSFYDCAVDAVVSDVPNFDLPFCQLVLKVSTNFKHSERYLSLVNLERTGFSNVDADVVPTWEDIDRTNSLKKRDRPETPPHHMSKKTKAVTQMVKCLKYMEYNKKNGGQVKEAVNDICELLQRNAQLIGLLDVEDVVHAINCFSSYNKRIVLYNNFLDVLCERSNDLLHAKNISLWIHPIISLAKISWFHKNYLRNVFDYVKDNYILSRLSVFQILKVLSSIVKMNVYDEQVYKVLIEQVYKEWDIIKVKMVDVATFLWSCAYVNVIFKPLFDSSYSLLIDSLEKESLTAENHVMSRNCLVNITWSYIVANYHKSNENFHHILNATFLDRDPNDSQAFKRLHQIADACFSEIPHCLVNVDAVDCMYKYCMHDKCRTLRNDFSVYKKEKDALKMRNRILSELTHMLKRFEVSYQLHFEPYHNSPYMIDILLNEGMKIGICVFGKEHLMRTLETASWDHMNSGFVSLQMRVLHAHGWQIIPINGGQWLQMNSEQKKALLRENFQRYSVLI
ncbi:RAP protein [Plasmodium cynomolgi strain B]|uniref:RAP protein n=1 Tax=Plasmodium cynomolgi (strain B) TaxID=1120755 RepID=K6VCG0_PLACD|nr:RAP protein [Plasmodium cynomolgi strain B]GAB66907.1 RAP protein [Plasmodium cynomolgi strain B]